MAGAYRVARAPQPPPLDVLVLGRRAGRRALAQPVRRRRRRAPAAGTDPGRDRAARARGAFAFVRSRDGGEGPSRGVAQRFADAWGRGDLARAFALTTATTRSEVSLSGFRESIRQAIRAATVERTEVGRAGAPRDGVVPVPVVMHTRLFGELRGKISFPVERSGDTARVAWAPALRLPGLRAGERVRRRILRRPRRAAVLDAGGARLGREPAAAGLVGAAPSGKDPGSGLEGMYDERLGGLPGAELRYGRRLIARVAVVAGRPVRTTIRPSLQAAATRALGDRLGGIAVLRPRDGSVLALAGLAVSARSHRARRSRSSRSPRRCRSARRTWTSRSRCRPRRRSRACGCATRATRPAAGRSPTRSRTRATPSSRRSARGSGPATGRLRRALRVQRATADPGGQAEHDPARTRLTDDLAVGASAIGQDRDLATPLVMASVGATIANGGVRARPRLVRSEKRVRRRVVKRRVAGRCAT